MNPIGLQVIDAICRQYNISIKGLLWGGQRAEYARPRQMACFMLREHARLSYPQIGKALGLHYTTVMYHHKSLSGAVDPRVISDVEDAQEFYRVIAQMEYDELIPF